MIALDGHCYERRAIATYLLNHSTSPVSGQALSSKLLIPNLGLHAQIRKFFPQSAAASANAAKGPKSFLSVSAMGDDGMDMSYFSCLPLAVLIYLSEFADACTLCRFGQTNHEHAAVASENRLWKLLVLRKGWSEMYIDCRHSSRRFGHEIHSFGHECRRCFPRLVAQRLFLLPNGLVACFHTAPDFTHEAHVERSAGKRRTEA